MGSNQSTETLPRIIRYHCYEQTEVEIRCSETPKKDPHVFVHTRERS
jgi:hypothetical protein